MFLAGDAAHLFTPLGGLGMNTGIGDVMNLVLEARRRAPGLGRPAAARQLRDRAPADRRAQFAIRRALHPQSWTAGCCRRASRTTVASADAARRSVRRQDHGGGPRAIRHRRHPARRALREFADRLARRRRSRRPTAGTPTRRSTGPARARRISGWRRSRAAFDEFGQGLDPDRFRRAGRGPRVETAAAPMRGVPLKILRLKPPDGLYRSKLVLVRPDQHIAWHGDAVADAHSRDRSRARGVACRRNQFEFLDDQRLMAAISVHLRISAAMKARELLPASRSSARRRAS